MDSQDLIWQNIPHCLRERTQWVCWRQHSKSGRGKGRKVPRDPKTGRPASSTDPATWGTFEQAFQACSNGGEYAGVGYVFSPYDPFCGIDLDDCIDDATGELRAWGSRIIDEMNSYAEVSPSGRGVKIFVRARKPGDRCKTGYADGEVEMYDRGRFFTVTGQRIEDVDPGVHDRQEQVDALYAEVFGDKGPALPVAPTLAMDAPGSPVLADEEIIALAGDPRRKNGAGAKFAALFEGRWNEHFNSASEADSSLCWTLAYYTKDAAQIDRIFRVSKLMRPKWDESRPGGTYGSDTIDKALAGVTGQYRPRKRPSFSKPAPDGGPGEDLPPLYRPDEVARLFVEANERIIYWRGVFHLYTGTCYQEVTEAELGARLARFITDVGWWTRPAKKDRNGLYEDGAVPHPDYANLMVVLEKVVPKTAHIREILLQLKIDYLTDATDAPVWMSAFSRPEASELMACRNGLLHLPTGVVHNHTAEFFGLNAVEYDHDPITPAPWAWTAFLTEIFDGDDECIDTLQELFGYFLLPDTRQQKIGLIVGPRRSGKGTIGRVLTGILGSANVCAPTLGSLSTNFGLWPLLNKQLAIISDARLSGRTDQAVVVERLLSISGEDTITADRKYVVPWTGRLPTRFLILTNELPRLSDTSGALAGRFVLLCLTRSWYGVEDIQLTDRLLTELPAILNWSIQGWRRLNKRGYFAHPRSSEEVLLQLEDLASPICAFIRERCNVGPGRSVEVNELFIAWQDWCQATGRANAGNIQSFGRDLRAAAPGLQTSQPRLAGGRIRFYEGIGLAAVNGTEEEWNAVEREPSYLWKNSGSRVKESKKRE